MRSRLPHSQTEALVIGICPVVQGLKRPVNDLSRCAPAGGIVYAIAIQAREA